MQFSRVQIATRVAGLLLPLGRSIVLCSNPHRTYGRARHWCCRSHTAWVRGASASVHALPHAAVTQSGWGASAIPGPASLPQISAMAWPSELSANSVPVSIRHCDSRSQAMSSSCVFLQLTPQVPTWTQLGSGFRKIPGPASLLQMVAIREPGETFWTFCDDSAVPPPPVPPPPVPQAITRGAMHTTRLTTTRKRNEVIFIVPSVSWVVVA